MSAGETNIVAAEAGPAKTQPAPVAVGKPLDRWPALILPAALAVLIVSLLPIAYGLFVAFQQAPSGFLTLSDDPRFWEAVRHTLNLAAIALPVELLLGLALASIFLGHMPGKKIFVSLLALPALAAPVMAGWAWRILFDNDYGPVNHALGWMTGGAVMTLWTEDPDLVYRAILIADIWQWTPFMALLLLAALTNVDRSQLEAAEIDDVGPWRTLLHVVMPAVWPAVAIAVLIRGLDLLRLFDVVLVLTRNGPEVRTETLSVFAYERLAQDVDRGTTAALVCTALLLVSLLAMPLLLRLERSR